MNKSKKNSKGYSNRITYSFPVRLSFWKKLKGWSSDYKWPLIGFIWVAAISLGYLGFNKYFSAIGETHSPWDIFYRTLQLLALESGFVSGSVGWELQVARFLVPLAAAYTAAQALAIIFKEQLQLFRIRLMKDHIVICGLGQKGLLLSLRFREREEQVVVIEQDEGNDLLRQCRDQGAIILLGNATDPMMLHKARVDKARYVISVCGDDGANAEVAIHARKLVFNRKGKALSCLIHISDFQLCNLLREREIRLGKLDAFRLELFNIFESGARILLDEYPPFSKTGKDYNSRAHLVVVGMGRMGESLIVNTARNWWDRDKKSGERLRITLIGHEAEKNKGSLCLRYPQLEKTCDLIPIELDIKAFEFDLGKSLFSDQGKCDVTMIYICLDDDKNALSAGLMMHHQVKTLEIPIVVCMTRDTGLAVLLRGDEDMLEIYNNLHVFGLLDHTCTPDFISRCTYEILARAIHEDYVRKERAKGHTPETNPSTVSWGELEETYKNSNRRAAEHIHAKLDAVGCDIAITTDWDTPQFEFTPEEVELLAQLEHKRWVDEKVGDRWRYGPSKDPEKKISPYIISWYELPEMEKDKDRDQVRYLPALLSRARFEIYRTRKKQ